MDNERAPDRFPICLGLSELEMTQLIAAVELLTTSVTQLNNMLPTSPEIRNLWLAAHHLEDEVTTAVRRHYEPLTPRLRGGK